VSGSLAVLRVLFRRYEFASEKQRKTMWSVVNSTFPILIQLFNYINTLPTSSDESAELQKLLCKIFWSATNIDFPELLIKDGTLLGNWFECFLTVLRQPVQTSDPSSPCWKVKKWVGHISQRILQKYGYPRGNTKLEQQLGNVFVKNYGGRFLEQWMNLCNSYRIDGNVSHQVLTLAINYMELCADHQVLYEFLYTHLDTLLFEIMFPIMCFNKNDAELWQDNPHEYVRKQTDIMTDLYNPRYSVANFLMKMTLPTKEFHKKDILTRILAFLNRVLSTGTSSCSQALLVTGVQMGVTPAGAPIHPAVKDGCLFAIGTLRRRLRDKDEYKNVLEEMLMTHVFPELQSPNGFLRGKAVWVFSRYAKIDWKNPENLGAAIRVTVSLMTDPELPVRVQAGSSLRDLLRKKHCQAVVVPLLEQMVTQLFNLMAEIDNDSVIETLEIIIERFGENLASAAVQLCHKLASHFVAKSPMDDASKQAVDFTTVVESKDDTEDFQDDQEDQILAAAACLRALCTLLFAMSEHKELYPSTEPILVPLFHMLMQKNRVVYMDETLEL